MKLSFISSTFTAAVVVGLAVFSTTTYAADLEIKAPPGGKVVVKDATGAATRLIIDGAGPVTLPGLPASVTVSAGVVCSDATGTLAKGPPVVGTQGPAGVAGATE